MLIKCEVKRGDDEHVQIRSPNGRKRREYERGEKKI
jgi:hypothetical protein